MKELEYQDGAAGIFLSSVHRAKDNTGNRPTINIVSSALMRAVIAEYGLEMKAFSDQFGLNTYPPDKSNMLFGYPVKVVESQSVFAISIDHQ